MRFRITRTSDWKNCPCREAVFNRETQEYNIEINTLEELVAFAKKYGELVFKDDNLYGKEKDIPSIEIYDDYRE